MGLGKTFCAITTILADIERNKVRNKAINPSLVICKKSLIFNWIEDAQKFYGKIPKILVLREIDFLKESQYTTMTADNVMEFDIIITSYEYIVASAKYKGYIGNRMTIKKYPLRAAIMDIEWRRVIC